MADLNKAMYDVLMVGMISSTIIYILGLALLFIQTTSPLEATVVQYTDLNQFLQQLVALRSSALLMLGTVILIATPIARVFVSILVFVVNGDRKFTLITITVFLILLVSIAMGYLWHFTPR